MKTFPCLPALILCLPICISISANEAPIKPADVLADLDMGSGKEGKLGRWGGPNKDGNRTFRAKNERSWSYFGIKPWWKEDKETPDEDVMVVITFKDVSAGEVNVIAHSGAKGGYAGVGRLGGSNDGKWKRGIIYCPKASCGRAKGGDYNGLWAFRITGGASQFDRIQITKPTKALKDECIRNARAARAASIEKLKKQFKHVPYKEKTPLGEVSAEHKKLGFIPYLRRYTVDIYPNTVPKPAERGARTIRSYATLGEFEPMQIGVYALKEQTFTASITDLVGPGSLRAGKKIELFWVEFTACRPKSSWGKEWQTRATWLRPVGKDGHPVTQRATAQANSSLCWYLRVHVPKSAKPGVYKGSLKLAANGGGTATFPIEFKVLPFVLDPAAHYSWGPYVSGPQTDEFIKDLVDHGQNAVSLFAPSGLKPKLKDGKCVLDLSPAMEAYLGKLRKHGITKLVDFGGGDKWFNNPSNLPTITKAKFGTPQFRKYYAEFWQDIKRLEKEKNWPEIICCPFDEPVKSGAKIRNYLTCYDIVKKVLPETKVFCVRMCFPERGQREQLPKHADIWSCNGKFEVYQAEKKKLAAQGVKKQFFTYTGCMAGYRPGSARSNTGLVPWHHDADATFFWAYRWSGGDPFNDLDSTHRDWSPIARDVDGKLYTCTCWEGYREGIDDRKYIETCLKLAREKGRKDILAEVKKIRVNYKSGEDSDESKRTHGLDDFFVKLGDAGKLDIVRAKMVKWILEMGPTK